MAQYTWRTDANQIVGSIYVGTDEKEYVSINAAQNGFANTPPDDVPNCAAGSWRYDSQMECKVDSDDEIIDEGGNRFWFLLRRRRHQA